MSSTFQQMGSIRNVANGNFTDRRKEVYEGVEALAQIRTWVRDNAFNGLLTLVDHQRGRVQVSGAIGIKEEVMQPKWGIVPQDIFVLDLLRDTNQI
jgi:hypothetical protein